MVHEFKTHQSDVYVLVCHPTLNHLILSGGYDGLIILWDISKMTAIKGKVCINRKEFNLNGRKILDGQFSPEGSFFAISDDLGMITLFGTAQFQENYLNTPSEQFFLNDYSRLIYDEYLNAGDEATQIAPHLLPRGPTYNASSIMNSSQFPLNFGTDIPSLFSEVEPFLIEASVAEQQVIDLERILNGRETKKKIRRRVNYGSDSEEAAQEPLIPIEMPMEDDIPIEDDASSENLSYQSVSDSDSDNFISSAEEEEEEENEEIRPRRTRNRNEPSYRLRNEPSYRSERLRQREISNHDEPDLDVDEIDVDVVSVPEPQQRPLRFRKRRKRPDEYRPSEWISSAERWLTPYTPQLYDKVMYYRQGHEVFVKNEQNNPDTQPQFHTDLPWDIDSTLNFCIECVVMDILYSVGPPTWVTLKLQYDENKVITVKYYDAINLSDFIILKSHHDWALQQEFHIGESVSLVYEKGEKYDGEIVSMHHVDNESFPNSPWLSIRVKR